MRRSPPSALERSLIYSELLLDLPRSEPSACLACRRMLIPCRCRAEPAQKLADKAAYP